MKAFFSAQADYIYFLYGAAFFLLAWISFILHRRKNDALPWMWLGLFACLNCLGIWSNIFILSYGSNPFLDIFRTTVTVTAFLASLEFGRRSAVASVRAKDALVKGIFGAAGIAFFLYAAAAIAGLRVSGVIVLAAGLKLSYALTAMFWVYQYYSENIAIARTMANKTRYFTAVLSAFLIVVISGYLVTDSVGRYHKNRYRAGLITRAETIASILNRDEIRSLSGSAADVTSENYIHLKKQLMAAAGVNREIAFIYLTGIRSDKKVFILADSVGESGRNYSPPGQVYEEASPRLIDSFSGARPFVEGPLQDRWGTWFSVFCPIRDAAGGKTIAVLGMDVDAGFHLRDVLSHRISGMLVSLILVIGYIVILQLYGSGFAKITAGETRFDTIAGQMGDGIIVCDPGFQVLRINPSAIKYLQIERTQGLNILEHVLANFSVSMGRSQVTDISAPHKSFDIVRKETGRFGALYLETHMDILKSFTGEVCGIILTLSDVTESRKERLVKHDFLRFISHKLRTPTAVIRGDADLLLDEKATGSLRDAQKKTVEAILRQSVLLAGLIDRLLKFIRISRDRIDSPKEEIVLRAYLDRLVGPIVGAVKEKKAEFGIDCPEDLRISADKESLGMVIEHLAENAVRFNDKDTLKIDIRARGLSGKVEILFSDNGPGIPPEEREKIFEGFYQIEKSFTGQVKGLGLGLALARHLVETSGGSITLESGVGKGATFIITIPK